MCNKHIILYTCRHAQDIHRPCSIVGHTTFIQQIVTQIPSHCPYCINEPDFPNREQQNWIPVPTLDGFLAAQKLWDRLHHLFAEEFAVADGTGVLRTNDSDHPFSQTALPEEDLNQMKEWLTLLQQSRRAPDAWEDDLGRGENWDKQLMVQVLRIIVINEITLREAFPPDAYLLTKVELTDLADDDETCPICYSDWGTAPEPDTKPCFPVQLPCGHVLGLTCLTRHFALPLPRGWVCPFCRTEFDANTHILKHPPDPITSPWWMGWLKRPFEEDP